MTKIFKSKNSTEKATKSTKVAPKKLKADKKTHVAGKGDSREIIRQACIRALNQNVSKPQAEMVMKELWDGILNFMVTNRDPEGNSKIYFRFGSIAITPRSHKVINPKTGEQITPKNTIKISVKISRVIKDMLNEMANNTENKKKTTTKTTKKVTKK